MDNFKIIYKILKGIDAQTGKKIDVTLFDYNALGIEPGKWLQMIRMLIADGYVGGITITDNIWDETSVDAEKAYLTIKGMEYLNNNSEMAKAKNLLAGAVKLITH